MDPAQESDDPLIEVVGSLNMDLVTVTPRVPGPGETIAATSFSTGFGGKGANQAVAAARLLRRDRHWLPDGEVLMHGAVGDDQFGKDFLNHLHDDEIVDVENVIAKIGFRTGTSTILVEEESGENRILFTKGANGEFTPEDAVKLRPVEKGRKHFVVLQLEIPMDSMIACVKAAKAAGKQVVLNPAPAQPLPDEVYATLDHLIVNEGEASTLSGIPESQVSTSPENARAFFLDKGVSNLVITLGSAGAYFCSQSGAAGLVGGHSVKAVDTTAAGDTFVGAYVVHLAKSNREDIAAAISYANAAASKAVTKAGAQASMPYAWDLKS